MYITNDSRRADDIVATQRQMSPPVPQCSVLRPALKSLCINTAKIKALTAIFLWVHTSKM